MQLSRNDIGRFYTKFIPGDPDSCWLWLGGTSKSYGRFRVKGETYLAHRVAYYAEFGSFNYLLDVCHTCDNTICVNPGHLFLGTALDNMQDAVSKGRIPKGETHSCCRISDADCEQMRIDRHTHGQSFNEIAARYEISVGHACDIVNGKKRI